MSNSPLVDYTKISPNSSNPRKNKIKKITLHHVAGDLTVEQIGNVFANKNRQASSNYGVDTDGRVGLYVEEKNRAWTSGNPDNDHQAITIEVSNNGGSPNWPVSDKALERTIELCVDICKRNEIEELNYTGDRNGNLTRHNMFQATICPGPYLQSKFSYIADEVNKKLQEGNTGTYTVKKGDTLWNISQANNLTVDELKKANNLKDDLINIGQELAIPQGGKSIPSRKPTKRPTKSEANLKVDGYWGQETTRALQKYFNTIVDGKISRPSMLIREIQKVVGARVDGYLGKETITKMQKRMGTPQDGVISRPSMMVKEMQRRLNQGKL